MGKRSNFKRKARDLYETTDPNAVAPLMRHLKFKDSFCEPCAGKFALIANLMDFEKYLRCKAAYDIKPGLKNAGIVQKDALKLTKKDLKGAKLIITNPPWTRAILHAMIERFMRLAPTWLLFDADWMHTQQAAPYMKHCKKIVSIGRVKWFKKSKQSGKDNCCWYLFDIKHTSGPKFYGRK